MALPWFVFAALTVAASGVALTLLLPGATSRTLLWQKPALLPLYAMLGSLDMDSATADSQGQNVLLEPTAYAPAALLLASQAFVMLFLLSALIALLACSYEAIANKADAMWEYGRVRVVQEYLEYRDVLPPPLGAVTSLLVDLPLALLWCLGGARSHDAGARVRPDGGPHSRRKPARPRSSRGLKLRQTLRR